MDTGQTIVTNEKDSKAIHDLLLEWGTVGGVDGFLQGVVDYITTARKEEREAARDAIRAFFGGLTSKQINLDDLLSALEAAAPVVSDCDPDN